MKTLFLWGYEGLAAMLPFGAAAILWSCWQKKHGRFVTGSVWAMALVLAFHAVGIYYFTGAGTLYDLFSYGGQIRAEQVNWLPFSRAIDPVAYGLNILLFLPFGFLVPWFCDRMASWQKVMAGGFALSLGIEISQLLNNRSTDVDDLILNTLGALVGWGVYCACRRHLPRLSRTLPPSLVWISFLVPFAGRFFLFYEIGLARQLYGF